MLWQRLGTGALFWLCFQVSQARAEIQDLSWDKLSVRLGITEPSIPLDIQRTKDDLDSIERLQYKQNPSPKLGIGVDWSWLGAYIAFKGLDPGLSAKDYGSTSYLDIQLHSFFSNYGIDFYYQRFKGYYQDETSSASNFFTQTPRVLRSDLTTSFAGANFMYVLHPERLSFGAIVNNSAIQSESGGSALLLAGLSMQAVASAAVLAPEGSELSYGRLGNIKRGQFATLSVGGGYGYTWFFDTRWYLHGSIALSLGPQLQSYTTRDFGSFDTPTISGKILARLGFGYNGAQWFGGIAVLADSTTFQVEERSLYFNSTFVMVSAGYRFDLPGVKAHEESPQAPQTN